MATKTATGVSFRIEANATSVVTTILANQTNGIVVTAVKVEREGSDYLTPNTAGKTVRLTISGSTSGSKEFWSYTAGTTGNGFPANTFSFTGVTLKGNINLTFSSSGSINYGPQGYVGGTFKVTITYTDAVTACTAPTLVYATRTRGVIAVGWQGASGGTNNAISNYGVIRNTSASTSGATTISSNASSSGINDSPGVGTYYYGVRAQGAAGSSYYSGYKWSSAVTMPSKPSTVSAGTIITKDQMDALRSWINVATSSMPLNSVTRGNIITAADGNTYRTGLTAGSTEIDDAWYNAALG